MVVYDVALWLGPEIDMPGGMGLPEIAEEIEAVSPFQAVVALMWAYGVGYVHRAACSDGRGMVVRWYRLCNHPGCVCEGVSIRRHEGSSVILAYGERSEEVMRWR